MTAEEKRLLNHRFREASAQQPELKLLKPLLLKLGGAYVVAPQRPDPDLPLLIEFGFVTSGPVLVKSMDHQACHRNVAEIWKARKHGVVAIGSGYALSSDDLWWEHSWGILREGILETTTKRLKYFGLVLQGAKADSFAKMNLG
jgi:hypothetical protein